MAHTVDMDAIQPAKTRHVWLIDQELTPSAVYLPCSEVLVCLCCEAHGCERLRRAQRPFVQVTGYGGLIVQWLLGARRAVCERRALRFARAVLVGAADFGCIEDVAAFADKTRQDGADPMFPLS